MLNNDPYALPRPHAEKLACAYTTLASGKTDLDLFFVRIHEGLADTLWTALKATLPDTPMILDGWRQRSEKEKIRLASFREGLIDIVKNHILRDMNGSWHMAHAINPNRSFDANYVHCTYNPFHGIITLRSLMDIAKWTWLPECANQGEMSMSAAGRLLLRQLGMPHWTRRMHRIPTTRYPLRRPARHAEIIG